MVAFGGMAWFAHSTVLLVLASSLASAASVTVDPTVTLSGGVYQYSYSITNDTPDDAFLIDIPVPAKPGEITNLTAPAGFQSAFDSGLGLVSFLEDTSLFGPAPIGGFSFESLDGPGAVTFAATLLSSSTGSLYTLSGPTTAPAPTAAEIPEPIYSLPVAITGGILVLFSVKGRQPLAKRQ